MEKSITFKGSAGGYGCSDIRSASAVRAFAQMTEGQRFAAKNVCIGPVTAEAAEKADISIDKIAGQYDLEGLTAALCDILCRNES